ncbi:MAG: hypothetical protein ACRDJP_14030 [Actinomycetota bacterium]
MDLYSVLIFAHVLGAVALFAALGIEVVAFRRLRGARTADQARTWMGPLREAGRLGPVAMVTILMAGVWMMALRWGPEPWILIALVGLVVMAVLGAALSRRPMGRLRGSLGDEVDHLPTDFRALVEGPLRISLWLRLAIAVGILGLMTVKPDALGSLVIMGAAVGVGVVAATRPHRKDVLAASRSEAAM